MSTEGRNFTKSVSASKETDSSAKVTLQPNASQTTGTEVVIQSGAGGAKTFTLPVPTAGSDTLSSSTSSETLSNKSISGSSNTITNVSLTTGVTGTLPIANGGTGQTGQTAAFDALAPTTTKGDLIVSNGTDNIRLAVGTNGQALKANSATASGLEWSTLTTAASGVAGAVQFSDGANLTSDVANFKFDDALNALGIGKTPSSGKGYLQVGAAGSLQTFAGTAGAVVQEVTGTSVALDAGGMIRVMSSTAQAADLGGSIGFGGNYSTTLSAVLAEIAGRKENSTDNNSAGYLQFATRANGGSITERMRIASDGKTTITVAGTTAPGAAGLTLTDSAGSSSNFVGLAFASTGNAGSSRINGYVDGGGATGGMIFLTGGATPTEKFRIAASGAITGNGTYTQTLANPRFVASNTAGTASSTALAADSAIGWVGTTTNHDFYIATNNTDKLRINTAGEVGVGGTPVGGMGKLQVDTGFAATDTSERTLAFFKSTDTAVPGTSPSGLYISYKGNASQASREVILSSITYGSGTLGTLKFNNGAFLIASDGRINGSSAIHRALGGQDTSSGTTAYIESGTYTATIKSISGLYPNNNLATIGGSAANSTFTVFFMRVGRVITVAGNTPFLVPSAINTRTQFEITVPYKTTVLDIAGSGTTRDGIYCASTSVTISGENAYFEYYPTTTNAAACHFSFTYRM